jgi:hypothetical protein
MNYSDTNYTIYEFDSFESLFLLAFGADRLQDCLYVYMLTPIAIIGFILNMLSFVVFMDKEFDKVPFFSFLRVYTVNSAVLLLFACSYLTANAYTFFTFGTSYPANFFFIRIAIPIGNTGYYFGTILDLLFTLNRITIFCKPVKKLFVLGPYKLCAAILAFCVITDVPYYMTYSPRLYTFSVFNSTNIVQLWYTGISDFSYSDIGTILTILLECWRDLFLALAEIAVNIWLIFCLKAYLKQRAALLHRRPMLPTVANPMAVETIETAGNAINNNGAVSSSTTRNLVKKTKKPTQTTGQQSEVSSADLRSTVMAIVVCALTIYVHISLIACIIYPYFDPTNMSTIAYLSYGAIISAAFKYAANFFVFYFFNKKFAEKLHKMFRC